MLAVEFSVEKPQGGIRFIKRKPFDDDDATIDENTYLATVDHNSCYWFPCVASASEPCTWKIECLVADELSVIASGNLVEIENHQIVQTASGGGGGDVGALDSSKPPGNQGQTTQNLKRYHYFMSVPTPALNIGLVVGRLESTSDESLPELAYYFDPMLRSLVKETCSCVNEIFEFYEETLSSHFPFGSYKLAFLPDLADDYVSFSSLTIVKYAYYCIM